MTKKQVEQFNRMRYFLLRINRCYMTPAEIQKKGEKMYGLSPEEVLEMAYENIQAEARHAVKGVKEISYNATKATLTVDKNSGSFVSKRLRKAVNVKPNSDMPTNGASPLNPNP